MGDTGGTGARTLNETTEAIIGCAFRVHNTLGYGFLERVYENALAVELARAGLAFVQQQRFEVLYEGTVVGEYIADLVVEDAVIVEIKVARTIDDAHTAQTLNYLAAAHKPVGLVLCFTGRVLVNRLRL